MKQEIKEAEGQMKVLLDKKDLIQSNSLTRNQREDLKADIAPFTIKSARKALNQLRQFTYNIK